MVLAMGLHPGVHAADQHPVVFYTKLAGDRVVSQRDGSHDTAQNAAQGYSQIQPGRVRRGCAG